MINPSNGLHSEQYKDVWQHKVVQDLHARFDEELANVKSSKEFEQLFTKFFSHSGLLSIELDTWRGADVPFEEAMAVAMELLFFKFVIQVMFFVRGYADEIANEWWEKVGPQRFDSLEFFHKEDVLRMLKKFDSEARAAKSLDELEQIGEKYLSPQGVLAKEFARAEKLEEKEQLETGAELLQARGYIECSLFAADFSTKSHVWNVPFVRGIVYGFERELKALESDSAAKALQKQYLGDDGIVEKASLRARAEKNEQAEELLKTFKESLTTFFASSTS